MFPRKVSWLRSRTHCPRLSTRSSVILCRRGALRRPLLAGTAADGVVSTLYMLRLAAALPRHRRRETTFRALPPTRESPEAALGLNEWRLGAVSRRPFIGEEGAFGAVVAEGNQRCGGEVAAASPAAFGASWGLNPGRMEARSGANMLSCWHLLLSTLWEGGNALESTPPQGSDAREATGQKQTTAASSRAAMASFAR